jgi:hypothetical protein
MSNQIAVRDEFDVAFNDLEKTQKLCASLMKTPHYAKIGEVGIFAIVQKAKTLGINPLDALNGSIYIVNGKTEMSGQAMLALIRKAGHSVTRDPKSTPTHITLHGKRCDNNDTWSASFSVEDAKKAKIYKMVWENYPELMCTWRCVSMLGRFLFPDVIKGMYVEGEVKDISESSPIIDIPFEIDAVEIIKESISSEQAEELKSIFNECSKDTQDLFLEFLKGPAMNIQSLDDLPKDQFAKIKKILIKKKAEVQDAPAN